MELEESAGIELKYDQRVKLPPLPEVHLVAIEDVRLPALRSQERELTRFYAGLLGLEPLQGVVGYRAANARLLFDLYDQAPPRDGFRTLGVIVPSLPTLSTKLRDLEAEFTFSRDVNGSDTLTLQDPAGNWVALSEMRRL